MPGLGMIWARIALNGANWSDPRLFWLLTVSIRSSAPYWYKAGVDHTLIVTNENVSDFRAWLP